MRRGGSARRAVVVVVVVGRRRLGRGRHELARARVEVDVAPQLGREPRGEARVLLEAAGLAAGVRARERLEREAVAVVRRREAHVALGGREQPALRLGVVGREPALVAERAADRRVDVVERVAQLAVAVLGRQLELEHEPVELRDDEHERQVLAQRGAQQALALGDEALERVDDEHGAVGDAHRRGRLVGERDVARAVAQVGAVALAARVGRDVDTGVALIELARLLVRARVGRARRLGRVVVAVVRVEQRVDEQRLARVQRPSSATLRSSDGAPSSPRRNALAERAARRPARRRGRRGPRPSSA